MKKMRVALICAVVTAVFVLSFLMGRATALKDEDSEKTHDDIYHGTVYIPREEKDEAAEEASATAEQVKKEVPLQPDIKRTKKITPPTRMIFPCGNSVQKLYSESAVFSDTMGDWRAHPGIDYAAELASPVSAAWDGVVIKVFTDKLWGNIVEIDHGGGVTARYCNLADNILVSVGQTVKCGMQIGSVGNSAAAESKEEPHLHLELYQDGIRINPESYVF